MLLLFNLKLSFISSLFFIAEMLVMVSANQLSEYIHNNNIWGT